MFLISEMCFISDNFGVCNEMYCVLCSEFYTHGHKNIHTLMCFVSSCFELLFNVICTSTFVKYPKFLSINPGSAEPGNTLTLQTLKIQLKKPADLDLLFVIKYVNFYQQPGSSNLIG